MKPLGNVTLPWKPGEEGRDVCPLSVQLPFHPIMTHLSILGHRGQGLVGGLPTIHSISPTRGSPNAPASAGALSPRAVPTAQALPSEVGDRGDRRRGHSSEWGEPPPWCWGGQVQRWAEAWAGAILCCVGLSHSWHSLPRSGVEKVREGLSWPHHGRVRGGGGAQRPLPLQGQESVRPGDPRLCLSALTFPRRVRSLEKVPSYKELSSERRIPGPWGTKPRSREAVGSEADGWGGGGREGGGGHECMWAGQGPEPCHASQDCARLGGMLALVLLLGPEQERHEPHPCTP